MLRYIFKRYLKKIFIFRKMRNSLFSNNSKLINVLNKRNSLTVFIFLFILFIYVFYPDDLKREIHKEKILMEKVVNSSKPELSIQNCNILFKSQVDSTSVYHPKIKDKTIHLNNGKEILIDDILYGYDLLFEKENRFSSASWLGVQNQQDPSDAFLIQMILYKIKPDLIIDIGTNTGGSSIFFASIMNYYNKNGKIITIDPKHYSKNWYNGQDACQDCQNPDTHSLWKKYVKFYQGYSSDQNIIKTIKDEALNATSILINHDGSHEGDIVYQDLKNYADICSIGSYMIVQDTKLDRMYKRKNANSLHNSIIRFLAEDDRYKMDRDLELFFFYTQHPTGFLKRVK